MKPYLCIFLFCTAAIALPFTDTDNPGIYGDKFEGDMILSPEQEKALLSGSKTGLVDEKYRWPNNIVPYHFVDLNNDEKKIVRSVLDKMEKDICLKFVERTNENDYIEVKNSGKGCFAAIGHKGGAQILNLQSNGCFSEDIIAHEFIHALGFHHMQGASDRDKYVAIKWDNILGHKKHNFQKYDENVISHLGMPYDYKSVMHYSSKAFSKNGKETIVSKTSQQIAPSDFMTEKDIQRIRNMYC